MDASQLSRSVPLTPVSVSVSGSVFFRFDETETETQVRGTLLLPFRFLIEDTVSIFSKLLSTSCLLTDSVPWLLPGAGHVIVTARLVEEALPPLRVLEHQTLHMERSQ